jgi:Squalene-hopene cyclase C-terminal domain
MSRTRGDLIDRTIEWLIVSEAIPLSARSGAPSLPRLLLEGNPVGDADRVSDVANVPPGMTRVETSAGPIWLQGSAVMCQCPRCAAPVPVRLWLMAADCWNCETAIELDYEQQEAVRELQEQASAAQAPGREVAPPRRLERLRNREIEPAIEFDSTEPARSAGRRSRLVRTLRKSVSMMPAWLISMLVHLIILLILAMILLPQAFTPESITLSTAVSPVDIEGGIRVDQPPDDPLEFDTALPADIEEIRDELRQVRIAADQDARELLVDPDPITTPVDLNRVIEDVTSRKGPAFSLATRDPRLRNELVEREGGTTLSEAAVARGLRWLASVQNVDGSWSLNRYHDHANPENRGDAAATSLALLPFLGAGQTHEQGLYRETVARGLRWLLEHQSEDGELSYGIPGDAGMYAHGQSSIVLVEALSMTGDERFRAPAQKAIDFIEAAQHREGGWRYQPKQPGDTSVVGWQLMALQAARNSRTGLVVDDTTLRLAGHFLDSVSKSCSQRRFRSVPAGSLYRYLPLDDEPKASMTAEALLCRMYLGWKRDDPRMRAGIKWLIENDLPSREQKNIYYWYYATQTMHHFGGDAWETWNNHIRDMLIVEQRRGGKYPGSWDPDDDEFGTAGGRIFVTAMAVCVLEVYYRHLPLFKQLDLN